MLGLEPELVLERGDGRRIVGGRDLHAVLADGGLEIGRRIERDDLALVDDGDAVAVLGFVHVVRGDEDGDLLALVQLVDVLPDRGAGLRIEPDGGLVEEQHLGRMQQAARDLEPAPHAAREGLHQIVLAVVEPDHLEHFLAARGGADAVDAIELAMEAEVLLGVR